MMGGGVERVGSDSHSRGTFGFTVLFVLREEWEQGCVWVSLHSLSD